MGSRLKVYARCDESEMSLLERKRIMLGLSTLALAKEADISRNSVWRIERNHHNQSVRPDIALRIVKALDRRSKELGSIGCVIEDIFEVKSIKCEKASAAFDKR